MSEIQDLIVKFDENKDRDTYLKIIECLRTAEKLWVAYSPVTNNFFLDILKGEKTVAFIFSEKEYYNVYEERVKNNSIEIQPYENTLENRMELFGNLYRSGFDLVVVDNGQKFVVIDLFDIIEKPDFSDIPQINRPVMNPSLVAAANNFFQAMSLKRPLREIEEKMYSEIYNARFLVPIDTSELKIDPNDSQNGKVVVKESSKIKIPLITNENNRNYIAIFTDWDELRKFDPEQKFGGNIIRFEDLSYFCSRNDGIVINPFGFNLILQEDTIKLIEDVVTGKKRLTETYFPSENRAENVMLEEPKAYPNKMVNEVKKCLKKHKEVKSAYLKLMIKDGTETWLIALDFEGSKKLIYDDIAEAAMSYAKGRFLSFIKLDTPLGQKVLKDSEPFYKA